MIIKLNGTTSLNKLPKIIKEVVTDIQNRAGLSSSSYKVKDVELGVLFKVNGEEMLLNTDIDGVKEPFKVVVALDEKGNIKAMKDNENESFMDEYEKRVTAGQEVAYEVIESVYNDEDLEEIYSEDGGDIVCIRYKHKNGERVERYYKNDQLVGELGYINK